MHIEPLESRIAPAGVVSIAATTTDLRFTGDAEANGIFINFEEGSESMHIAAAPGTMLQFGDQTGTSFDIPLGARKNMRIDLGAGDDELTLTDISLAGKLDIKGGAGNNTVTIGGLMEEEGIFYYTGGDGNDTLLSDFGPGGGLSASSVLIDLKGGDNFMDYTDDACMFRTTGIFQVLAGSGNDTIEIGGASANFGGLVTKLGAGTNSYRLELENTMVSGYVLAEGGGGADSLSLLSGGDLAIRKTLTTNFGDGAAAVTVGAAQTISVGGKSAFTFGKTQASPAEGASVQIGGGNVRLGEVNFRSSNEWFAEATCVIAGYVDGVDAATPANSVTLGALNAQGVTDVTVNAANAITVRGSIAIKSDTGAATSRVAITAASVDIGKDLTFTDGAGDADFTLVGDSISVVGRIALNLGDTATHEVISLGVAGGTVAAGSVSMLSRTETVDNNETITVAAAGRIETVGAFSIVDGGAAFEAHFTGVDLDIGRGFTIALGSGDADVSLQGGSFIVGGPLVIGSNSLPGDVETVSSIWNFHVWVDAIVKMGAGASSFTHESDTGGIRNLSLDLGAGANNAKLESGGGLNIGKLVHKSQSGAAAVLDRLAIEGVVVKEINATFGAVDSVLAIAASRVGKLTANLGAGADRARLDDSIFTGDVTILAGVGADDIEVENDETHWVGHDRFLGRVTFDLGAGDDDVIIAGPADATKAQFFAALIVNGGEGTDTFTPHATHATFAIAPVLTSIP